MGLGIRNKIRKGYLGFYRKKIDLAYTFLGYEPLVRYLVTCPKPLVPYILRKLGCVVGNHLDLNTPLYLHNVNKGASNLVIGDHVHIGRGTHLDLHDRLEIGSNSTISMGCMLLTHQDAGKSPVVSYMPVEHDPIILEKGVYLGAGVIVLKNVKIGEAALVAAGALVNHPVHAKSVYAGAPARKIRSYA